MSNRPSTSISTSSQAHSQQRGPVYPTHSSTTAISPSLTSSLSRHKHSTTNKSPKNRPKILMMGLRKSGKSSIQQVIFNKNEIEKHKDNRDNLLSLIDFSIWDFLNGQVDFFDPAFDSMAVFGGVKAVVFVIDTQDDYIEALSKLFLTVTRAFRSNPLISFEVLLHKADGLTEEYKIELQRDIQQRMADELLDAEILDHVQLNYYLTSIYDHSIFEVFSKIIQKMLPELGVLENLLNMLCTSSSIDKAFLFELHSKVYVATDSSPVDSQSFELCSDMIDVVMDMSTIYSFTSENNNENHDGIRNDMVIETDKTDDEPAVTEKRIEQLSPPTEQNRIEKPSAVIQLNNGTVLALTHITSSFVLLCLIRSDTFVERRGWLEINFQTIRHSINEVFSNRRL